MCHTFKYCLQWSLSVSLLIMRTYTSMRSISYEYFSWIDLTFIFNVSGAALKCWFCHCLTYRCDLLRVKSHCPVSAMSYLLIRISHCSSKIKCPFTTIWNKLDFNLESSHLIATVTAHVFLVCYKASGFPCIFIHWLFSPMPLGFLSVKYTVRPQWYFQNIHF